MKIPSENTTHDGPWCSLRVEWKKFYLSIRILGICFILVLLSSCTPPEEANKENNRLVAKVFNKTLFQSELDALIGPQASPEDSTRISKAYIEKWLREAVLMNEAEKYVPSDLNIDALVRDYRASLIRHNYEKLLVETSLDSTINQTELDAYYQENKEQFKLEEPILRCHFLKVPKSIDNWSEVKDWWDSDDEEDFKRLLDFCSRNAALYMLDDDQWYYLSDIMQHLPDVKLSQSNYKSIKNLQVDDDSYEYLLKVFDTTSDGEYAPLAFIKGQATKVILHKRKIKLLEEKKEEMYERESGRVKIYVE